MTKTKRVVPQTDLSANSEKGAAVGGVAGAAVGAVVGTTLGPAGAAIGAVIGGVVGAVGTSVAVAAADTEGEEIVRPEVQEETDRTIERNSMQDDSPLEVARAWVDNDPI